jgi:hypothetical protein
MSISSGGNDGRRLVISGRLFNSRRSGIAVKTQEIVITPAYFVILVFYVFLRILNLLPLFTSSTKSSLRRTRNCSGDNLTNIDNFEPRKTLETNSLHELVDYVSFSRVLLLPDPRCLDFYPRKCNLLL